MSIGIVTDTACDLPLTTLFEQGIAFVNHELVIEGQRKRDWRDVDPTMLYQILESSTVLPQLLAPDKDDFKKVYIRFLGQHEHIISIHVASQMSKTLRNAHQARNELKAENKITIIDSKTINVALAEMVLEANKLAKDGAPKDHILWSIEHILGSSSLYFSPESIKWLARRRESSSSKIVESFQNQRPIFKLSHGKTERVATVSGAQINTSIANALKADFQNNPIHLALSYAGDNRVEIDRAKHSLELSGLDIIQGRAQIMGSLLGIMLGPKSISIYAHKALSASLKL